MSSNRESKRSRTVSQPKGTATYTVGETDTLEKVSLRFNSTPSELMKLNKLQMRVVFPGQVLFVPEESSISPVPRKLSLAASLPSPSSATKTQDADAFVLLTDRRTSMDAFSSSSPPQKASQEANSMVWSMARQIPLHPGRAHRLSTESSMESESPLKTIEDHFKPQKTDRSESTPVLQRTIPVEENQHLDDECLKRFLKINVQLLNEDRPCDNKPTSAAMIDRCRRRKPRDKRIAGTLLVTPNAVMFDPDLRDPSVKEHGIDKYGLIIRLNLLASISLYEDTAIYEREATMREEERRRSHRSSSIRNSFTDFDDQSIHDTVSTLLDQIEHPSNPVSSDEGCCVLFDANSALHRQQSIHSLVHHSDDDAFLPSPIPENILDQTDPSADSNDQWQSSSDAQESMGLLSERDMNAMNRNYNRIPSQGCRLKNCGAIDQFQERFGEIDKLLHQQQQNYSTPRSIDVPFYLCLKTSVSVSDIPSLQPRQYKKSNGTSSIDNPYGRKQLEREYWFSLPKDKTDSLHHFFLRWTPEHHVDLGDAEKSPAIDLLSSKDGEENVGQGFVLLANDDPELTGDPSSVTPDNSNSSKPHYLKRQNTLLKDWEIISIDEIYRRYNSSHSNHMHTVDPGIAAPTFLQPSTLINEERSKQILLELPARLHGLNWCMAFSTESHGFSLNQLYRRSLEFDHDSPSLMIVKDVDQHMFGAFVPHRLMISESFYGTGESFLFTFHPEFQVFNWSNCNEFFVKGDLHALGFGIGEGTHGLWMDADLYHGRTCASKTFNSKPLAPNEDFIIASVEVWTFLD